MFGRLLRMTGTVLVIAVAFVTPVFATSTPASADTVVNGCTIVANRTSTNFTNCPGANLSGANLSGVNLSYANLADAQLADGCNLTGGFPFFSLECSGAILDGAKLTGANLSNASFVNCAEVDNFFVGCGGATLRGADLTDADLAGATFTGCIGPFQFARLACGITDLSGANLSDADFAGAVLETCPLGVGFGFPCGSPNLSGANLTGTLFTPSNQTVEATSSVGSVVTWTVPGQFVSASPTSCTPASGFIFPIGTTTVTCTVFDDFGGSATGTFLVTVLQPTSTSVSSLADPSLVGQQVTYTATMSPAPTGGTVAFNDNGSPITGCSAVPLSGASASCLTTPGTTGTHNIVATYNGLGGFLGSTSPRLTQVVTKTPCTTLAGCNLSGLNLSGASLAGANLQTANLNGANLTGATLTGVNLGGANLKSANLMGANLSGASVTADTNFNDVTWGRSTCPDGTNSDNDGGTCVGHL
jgi:uncharacterized protein YjbI with pentapeptide repeats